jgi:hypothetical protein
VRPIDANDGMMDGRAAGVKLDSANEAAGTDGRGKHDLSIPIAGARRQNERLGHRDDEIRLTELPAVRKRWHPRQIARAAFGRTTRRPRAQQRDLIVTQPPLVQERDFTSLGRPRRHFVRARGIGDGVRVLPGVFVGNEGKRRDLTGRWQVTQLA